MNNLCLRTVHAILCNICGYDAGVELEDFDIKAVEILCGQCFAFVLRDNDDKQIY